MKLFQILSRVRLRKELREDLERVQDILKHQTVLVLVREENAKILLQRVTRIQGSLVLLENVVADLVLDVRMGQKVQDLLDELSALSENRQLLLGQVNPVENLRDLAVAAEHFLAE